MNRSAYEILVLIICVIITIAMMKQSNFQRDFKKMTFFQQSDSHTISSNSVSEDRNLSQRDDISEADLLKTKVRVLVMVVTAPKYHKDRVKAVKETWGQRVDVLYMSSVNDSSIPTIDLNVTEGRDHLMSKTMKGFQYMHDHYLNDYDWFMKADDDTYIIVENLRLFLSDLDPSDPVYYGHLFDIHVHQGYNSGGAGYVLSKEALIRLNTKGKSKFVCFQDGAEEDIFIGHCMDNLGISTANTTDAYGRTRFNCFMPDAHLGQRFPVMPDWYRERDANGGFQGVDTVSDFPISFHYMEPKMMLSFHYSVYRLGAYGAHRAGREVHAHNPNKLMLRDPSILKN